ncbi:hypothetical protein TcYC6_0028730 [Trypanosoma cruzi]|uniref:Developmentally regulated protein n=2 Tax=Trypanosoma cruzi TaxID=5693 RepID=Q4D300_TRYCC|nr:hypothetical protein, conserved [Trypanosoma cruzi]XP_808753.1 hypothetical protein, conserved [Trypanosoma cruzi]PBJ78286.1 hypothetical protein BCY84_04876 [Trypanosoma cruzi cruzi]AAF21434.1 developmentally regulated protein [Trypanosoma cruzi]EAN81358.1 hypothetical protein, conserved [Trypanosoma cruzi]EAN86902.1 hypothetical protein, conserved [Trypanosoma cruzi]KAF8280944.1 hypothetical protein TcYC6_0028740 [Trypanosoma cruzi]|eukprot:XP_802804.1 hypothetical protein [Trypanosoma cruzi strain CL Brener]
MLVKLDKWWKSKAHRRIRGARGARFASLRFHAVFIFAAVGLVEWVMRSTESPTVYHISPPPVPAPPPLPTSIGYSLGQEMPHLRSMELEAEIPPQVPQVRGLDYVSLRKDGRFL